MKSLLLTAIVLLASCSTVRVYEKYLDEWEGKERSELIAKLGQPDRIHSLTDGQKVYQYKFTGTYGGPARFNKFRRETSAIPDNCLVWFFIDRETEIIDKWKWEGANCSVK